jgi:hypothetical protein
VSTVIEHGCAVIIGVDDNQISQLALPTVAKDVQMVYVLVLYLDQCACKRSGSCE